MSNSDSFVSEVTDEMRREKLFGYLKRYGWIGVLAVLGIVGGTAWNEYRIAQRAADAAAAGDALLAALAENDPAARADAMAQVPATGAAAAITGLLTAVTQFDAGDYAAAGATLAQVSADPATPALYRDLALLRIAMLPTDDTAARLGALAPLSQAGQPFRLIALEQMAYLTLQGGDAPGAIAILRAIEEDAAVTPGQRDRAQTMMIALGAAPAEQQDGTQP